MSSEYKYNFFLRLFLEVYLECMILSLINIRYARFEEVLQWVSLITACVLICIFQIWVVLYLKRYPSKILNQGAKAFEDKSIGTLPFSFSIFLVFY